MKKKTVMAWGMILVLLMSLIPTKNIKAEEPHGIFIEIDAPESYTDVEVNYSLNQGTNWVNLPGDFHFLPIDPDEDLSTFGYSSYSDWQTSGSGSFWLSVTIVDTKFFGNSYITEGWGNREYLIENDVSVDGTAHKRTLTIKSESLLGPAASGGFADITSKSLPRLALAVTDYERQGDGRIAPVIENRLYAYSDLNNDGNVDSADMKIGLATELCAQFFWDDGNPPELDGGNFGVTKPADFNTLLTITDSGATYQASKADGSSVTLKKYDYAIDLGMTEDGIAVQPSGVVYALENWNDVLVDTGNAFYIRTITDSNTVSVDANAPGDMSHIVSADFNPATVRINGNGGGSAETINPEGSSVYCVFLRKEDFVNTYNKYYGALYSSVSDFTGNTKIRIMKPQDTYVVVNGSGETRDVPGLSNGQIDNICQTGNNKETNVFVGYNEITIGSVASGTGASDATISAVTLVGDYPTTGVELQNLGGGQYKVIFHSNFYDSVTLHVTYSGGSQGDITINRTGLVIQYQYLMDPFDSSDQNVKLFHGNEESSVEVTYNYSRGQQILVWGTYYHPSNDSTLSGQSDLVLLVTKADGSVTVIDKTEYVGPSSSVATTDFVIGFLGKNDTNFGAINAIVMNGDFNTTDTYGGTQVGSGKGVYWDGSVSFTK